MRLAFFSILILVGLASSYSLNKYESIVTLMSTLDPFKLDFEQNLNYLQSIEPNYFNYVPEDFSFDCQTNISMKSRQVPTSVHQLRPNDIQVVSAIGDSLTAALGARAKTILGMLIENRGHSWSEGGYQSLEKAVTMPNFLKKFNPNLRGYSTKSDLAIFDEDGVGLNVAVSGQEANHMTAQARKLIDRLKHSREFDFNNDWKMVTLFIGGNDLCDSCNNIPLHEPTAYVNYLQEALDLLHKELPRTFVNLVQVLNVTEVKYLNRGRVCSFLHKKVCPCAAYPASKQAEDILDSYIRGYHTLTQSLVDSGRYETRDDFTVVIQPFFKDFTLPRLKDDSIDFSYMAPDCFHLSPKGFN